MKKTYITPTNKSIILDDEFCNSITGSNGMPIDNTPDVGQIGGGMTNEQQSGSSLWDNWNND